MLSVLRRLRERLRLSSLQRGDYTHASERPVENLDALTAASSRDIDFDPTDGTGGGIPPGYVKSYDEGRPRK